MGLISENSLIRTDQLLDLLDALERSIRGEDLDPNAQVWSPGRRA